MRTCELEGCKGKHKAKGLCAKHYRRKARRGTTDDHPRTHAPPVERVFRRSEANNGCLEFQGSRNSDGYGHVKVDGKTQLAHRVVAIHFFGKEEVDKHIVCHKCDNPSCVWPPHLFLGTHSDNAQDRENKGRGNDIRGENNPQYKLRKKAGKSCTL